MSSAFSLLNSRGHVSLSANGQLFAYQLQNVIYVREATREMPVRVAFQVPSSKKELHISFSFCGNYILYYELPTDKEIHIFRLGSESSFSSYSRGTGPDRIIPYSTHSDKQVCIQVNALGIRYAAFSPNLTIFCVTSTTSEVLEIRFLSAWGKSVRFSTRDVAGVSRANKQEETVLLRAVPGAKTPFLFTAELLHVAFISNNYCQDKLHIIGTSEPLNSVIDFPEETFDATYLTILGQKTYLTVDFYNSILYKVQLITKNEANVVRYEARIPYQLNSAISKNLSLTLSAIATQDVHIAIVYTNSRATILSKNLQERMIITGLPDLLEYCENVFVECRCKGVISASHNQQEYCVCDASAPLSRSAFSANLSHHREITKIETEEHLIYQEVTSMTEDSEHDICVKSERNQTKSHQKWSNNEREEMVICSNDTCTRCGLTLALGACSSSESQIYDFPSLNPHSYLVKTCFEYLTTQYAFKNKTFHPPRLIGIEAYLKRNIRGDYISKAKFSPCCRFLAYVGVQYPTTLIIVDPLEMKLVTILVFYDIIVDFIFIQTNLYVLTSALVEEYKDYNFHNELDIFASSCTHMHFEKNLRPVVITATGNQHLPNSVENRLFKWSPRQLPSYIPLPHDISNKRLLRMHLAYNDTLLINTDCNLAVLTTLN